MGTDMGTRGVHMYTHRYMGHAHIHTGTWNVTCPYTGTQGVHTHTGHTGHAHVHTWVQGHAHMSTGTWACTCTLHVCDVCLSVYMLECACVCVLSVGVDV